MCNSLVGFWDIGGSDACKTILPSILQNIKFSAIIYVIDISKEVKSLYGGIKIRSTNPAVRGISY